MSRRHWNCHTVCRGQGSIGEKRVMIKATWTLSILFPRRGGMNEFKCIESELVFWDKFNKSKIGGVVTLLLYCMFPVCWIDPHFKEFSSLLPTTPPPKFILVLTEYHIVCVQFIIYTFYIVASVPIKYSISLSCIVSLWHVGCLDVLVCMFSLDTAWRRRCLVSILKVITEKNLI